MTFEEYQTAILRTLPGLPSRDVLAMLALGVADEAGEVAGVVKKHLYQGHPMEDAKLVEEIGDVLWYLTNLCTMIGYDVAEVAARNVAKLKARYPSGFDSHRSRVRLIETDDGLIGGVLIPDGFMHEVFVKNAGPDLAKGEIYFGAQNATAADVVARQAPQTYGTDTLDDATEEYRYDPDTFDAATKRLWPDG